ncbi:hypothetical protein ACWX0P_28895 [Vibrio mediterranei]
MTTKKILIIGAGNLASMVGQQLAWRNNDLEIFFGARSVAEANLLVNSIKFTSSNLGNTRLHVCAIYMDLYNVEQSSATIDEIKPDLIFNTATDQAYWVAAELPPEVYREVAKAGIGPWTACHAAPVAALMQACSQSSYKGPVVNAAFPDAVNPLFNHSTYAPTIGIGNVANIVQPIRHAVSCMTNTDVFDIDIKMIAHHVVGNTIPSEGDTNGAPFYIQASAKGEVISNLDAKAVFEHVQTSLKRKRGKEGMWVTSSSAVSVLEGLISEENCIKTHAPGINGLVGGYPVKITKGQAVLDLPEHMTLSDARAINEQGQYYDGIQSIDQGYLEVADFSQDIFRKFLNVDLQGFHLSEARDVSQEILAKFREVMIKHG